MGNLGVLDRWLIRLAGTVMPGAVGGVALARRDSNLSDSVHDCSQIDSQIGLDRKLPSTVTASVVAEVVRLRFLPLCPEVSRLRLLLVFRRVMINAPKSHTALPNLPCLPVLSTCRICTNLPWSHRPTRSRTLAKTHAEVSVASSLQTNENARCWHINRQLVVDDLPASWSCRRTPVELLDELRTPSQGDV